MKKEDLKLNYAMLVLVESSGSIERLLRLYRMLSPDAQELHRPYFTKRKNEILKKPWKQKENRIRMLKKKCGLDS